MKNKITIQTTNGSFDVSKFTVVENYLGQNTLTFDLEFMKSEVPIFSLDWHCFFNGIKYVNKSTDPYSEKDNSSELYRFTLVFSPEYEQKLSSQIFVDFVDENNLQRGLYDTNFTFSGNLYQFIDRLRLNLLYYYPNDIEVNLNPNYDYSEFSSLFEANNISLWDTLNAVYEVYGVEWSVKYDGNKAVIYVGYDVAEIEHIFEYRKGLRGITKSNNTDNIVTALKFSGTKDNLPLNYLHNRYDQELQDPDASDDFLYGRGVLLGESARLSVRGWNDAVSGLPPQHEDLEAYMWGYERQKRDDKFDVRDFIISPNAEKYGIRWQAITDISATKPSLQGKSKAGLGRLDEIVAVEQVLNDDYEQTGKEENSIDIDYRFEIPFNKLETGLSVFNNELTPSIVEFNIEEDGEYNLKTYVALSFTSPAESLFGYFRYRIERKNDNGTWGLLKYEWADIKSINPITLSEHSFVGGTYRIVVTMDGNTGVYDGKDYGAIGGSFGNIRLEDYSTPSEEFKQTFDVWIKDIGFNPGDDKYWLPEDMELYFSSGLLAGEDRDFKIVQELDSNGKVIKLAVNEDSSKSIVTKDIDGSNITVPSKYRITLEKNYSELDATDLPLPNKVINAKAGDFFFLVNLQMPYDTYVFEAEKELEEYAWDVLSEKDHDILTYGITLDEIDYASFVEADKIIAGARVRVGDEEIVGEAYTTLYLNTITRKFGDKMLPDITFIVSNTLEPSLSVIGSIQNELQSLSSGVFGSRQAINNYITETGNNKFIRKDIPDIAYSRISFQEGIDVSGNINANDGITTESIVTPNYVKGQFGGSGATIQELEGGAGYIETDNLVVRGKLSVNETVINTILFESGNKVLTAAGMVCSESYMLATNEVARLGADATLATGSGWIYGLNNVFVEFDGVPCISMKPNVGISYGGVYTAVNKDNVTWTASADFYFDNLGDVGALMSIGSSYFNVTADMIGKWTRITGTYDSNSSNYFRCQYVQTAAIAGNMYAKNVMASADGTIDFTNASGTTYRCFMDIHGGSLTNGFIVGDMAYCQRYNPNFTNLTKFYWLPVVGVASNYIDLGVNEGIYEDGSMPEVGDNIIQLGNKTDSRRQGAIIYNVLREEGPMLSVYANINDYSLTNKNYVDIGVSGDIAEFTAYGKSYVGSRDQSQYVKYEDGNLDVRGRITITGGGAREELDALGSEIDNIQNQIDGISYSYFGEVDPLPTQEDSTTNYPADSWSSDEEKERHLNSVYTNTINGYSWKWIKDDEDVYYWIIITDDALLEALRLSQEARQLASEAQNAANTAQNTANAAQDAANQAQIDADEGKISAEEAQALAEEAQRLAEEADALAEEAQRLAEEANKNADKKTQTFTNTPVPPYNIGDLWSQPDKPLMKCIVAKLMGEQFSSSDWGRADNSDNTKTVLDNGVATDGKIVVGKWNENNGEIIGMAGLTGENPDDNTAVRIWAGADNPTVAPFRVSQNGQVVSNDALIDGVFKTLTNENSWIQIRTLFSTTEESRSEIAGYVNNQRQMLLSTNKASSAVLRLDSISGQVPYHAVYTDSGFRAHINPNGMQGIDQASSAVEIGTTNSQYVLFKLKGLSEAWANNPDDYSVWNDRGLLRIGEHYRWTTVSRSGTIVDVRKYDILRLLPSMGSGSHIYLPTGEEYNGYKVIIFNNSGYTQEIRKQGYSANGIILQNGYTVELVYEYISTNTWRLISQPTNTAI